MNDSDCGLALGTVQFGLAYGAAGRGEPVPAAEVREILAEAWRSGVRVLDTAPVYGDIEPRLADLAGSHSFAYVTKIPALPKDASSEAAARFVRDSIATSRVRLGEGLSTILFHNGDDLLASSGEAAWEAATRAVAGTSARLGGSFYSPDAALAARARFPIAVAQLPGNAFDQRLAALAAGLAGVEVHLRSVFLQGILLQPLARAVALLPQATAALTAWTHWCARQGVSPLRAALGIARSLPNVRYCVVGVDRVAHLRDIVTAWREASPMQAPALASGDEEIIDPRRWRAA